MAKTHSQAHYTPYGAANNHFLFSKRDIREIFSIIKRAAERSATLSCGIQAVVILNRISFSLRNDGYYSDRMLKVPVHDYLVELMNRGFTNRICHSTARLYVHSGKPYLAGLETGLMDISHDDWLINMVILVGTLAHLYIKLGRPITDEPIDEYALNVIQYMSTASSANAETILSAICLAPPHIV